jgi:hypothetical protein
MNINPAAPIDPQPGAQRAWSRAAGHRRLLLISMVLGALAGLTVSGMQTKVYASRTTLMIPTTCPHGVDLDLPCMDCGLSFPRHRHIDHEEILMGIKPGIKAKWYGQAPSVCPHGFLTNASGCAHGTAQ